ncbi:MAG: helix-turn-helix domain-containing protein [Candidatus Sericytochromatia bacterium]
MQSSIKLGEEIKRVRILLKKEQKEFAQILGISNVYLSNIEKGKKIPSPELLKKIYAHLDKDIPESILEIVKKSKEETKVNSNISSSTIIYELQEKGLYSLSKLKDLIKAEPSNIKYIYALLSLLKEEGKLSDARNLLLISLTHIKKDEEKRWLEACYFIFEGNYSTAISLMKECILEYDKARKNTELNELEFKKRKANLLFELANMYYEYGYYSYNVLGKKELSIDNFKQALFYFEEQRSLYNEPTYEIYYTNVFWWLSHLNIETSKNRLEFIERAENLLILNHQEMMKNSSIGNIVGGGLYSPAYLCQITGAIAESYIKQAIEEKNQKDKINFIKKGELLLIQNVPLKILPNKREYYNFYFSYACFYALKASLYYNMGLNYEIDLDLCYKGLSEALFSDKKQNIKQFYQDLKEAEKNEFNFYTQKRKEDFDRIIERCLDNE